MSRLKLVGFVLVVLGLGLGVVAYRSASSSGGAQASAAAPMDQVVVALDVLPAGENIRARSVGLKGVTLVPEGSFTRIEDVLDRAPSVRLTRGEPLLARHFGAEGGIARMLRTGERAVAVRVDGVIGLGGFIRPGDRVDVLFFLRRDGREVDETQARTLLSGVRVLAFGKQVEARGDPRPTPDARTAVLAVPERHAPLLLLGETAGKLRLALRQGKASERRSTRLPRATLFDLLGETAESSPATPAAPVTVIRGGEREHRGARR